MKMRCFTRRAERRAVEHALIERLAPEALARYATRQQDVAGQKVRASDERFLVVILGTIVLAAIGGIVLLTFFDKTVPEGLVIIASGAAGALGMSGSRGRGPTPRPHVAATIEGDMQ